MVGMAAHRWRAPGCALVVLAVVAGYAGCLWRLREPEQRVCTTAPVTSKAVSTPATATPAAPSRPLPTGWAASMLDEGDAAVASGIVRASACGPVLFCVPDAGDFTGPGRCAYGIEARGVDLDALAERYVTSGVTVGLATLRGVWRGGVLTVTHQSPWQRPPRPPVPGPGPPPPRPPCPPPPGGWLRESLTRSELELHAHVQQRPDRYDPPWRSWPQGYSSLDSSLPENRNRPLVVVVEVRTGDIDRARAELRAAYSGNLCVVPTTGDPPEPHWQLWPRSPDIDPLRPVLNAFEQTVWLHESGPHDWITVHCVALDRRLAEALDAHDRDRIVIVRPWLLPAG